MLAALFTFLFILYISGGLIIGIKLKSIFNIPLLITIIIISLIIGNYIDATICIIKDMI